MIHLGKVFGVRQWLEILEEIGAGIEWNLPVPINVPIEAKFKHLELMPYSFGGYRFLKMILQGPSYKVPEWCYQIDLAQFPFSDTIICILDDSNDELV